jgi:hypothetical protein
MPTRVEVAVILRRERIDNPWQPWRWVLAKAAHAGKVDAYQLCKSQDKVAAHYLKSTKTASKDAKPAASPCVDPGAFVAAPPAAAPAAAAASAPAIASAPTDKDKKKP